MKIGTLVLAGAFALSATAAELPELKFPAGTGVNIHFTTGHETDLGKIKDAGFKFVRMDFGWGGIERKKGEYDWSAYDTLTANLEKRGLRAVYILDYSNPLYEEAIVSKNPVNGEEQRDIASPQHPESVAAYATWATAAAKHFADRHIIWEIWNEPNIGFWKPKPDAKQYATLAVAAAKSIRKSVPNATIVAPASSEFPWSFYETAFANGVLENIDAVSVHPYRGGPPETATADYLKLHGLIARYAPPGKKNLPILSGEWGYATNDKGVSLETQAAYIVRQQIINQWSGVPLSIWYDWKNDGGDRKYSEHNFGTVTEDLKPKPSYEAVQLFTRQLGGYRVARRLDIASDEDHVFLCVDDAGHQKLVGWTTAPERNTTVDIGTQVGNSLTGIDGKGGPLPITAQGTKLSFKVGPMPAYITLPNPLESLALAGAWQTSLPEGVLIKAGLNDGVKINFHWQNPVARDIRARLTALIPGEPEPFIKEVALKASAALDQIVKFPIYRRDAEFTNVVLRMEYFEGKERKLLSRSIERLPIVIENPLYFTLAPIEKGTRLEFSSPSGAAFSGRVVLLDSAQKITLDASQPTMRMDVPGELKAPLPAMKLGVFDDAGHSVASLNLANFRPLKIEHYRAALDGDAKVDAKAAINNVVSPGGDEAPYARALKLDFQFGDGWRFVQCLPEPGQPLAIEGRPRAFGLWVYGDASETSLRIRLADSGGQTFQFSGPKMDWKGWRWVTIDLSDARKAGHWGGANDGAYHGDLRWESPLLVDGIRTKLTGAIYIAGPTLIYP